MADSTLGLVEVVLHGLCADVAREDLEVLAHAVADMLLHGCVEHLEVPRELDPNSAMSETVTVSGSTDTKTSE